VQSRDLICVPTPQVTGHDIQLFQAPDIPSTLHINTNNNIANAYMWTTGIAL